MIDPVLLIAGRGALPRVLASALADRALVLALEGSADRATCALAHQILPLGQFGAMIEVGRQARARGVLFVGGVERPSAQQLNLDTYSRQHLDVGALTQGDDAVLRAVAKLFAHAGLETLGPLDLAPDLAMPQENLSPSRPDPGAHQDAQRGLEVARTLGALDVGQAVVVQQGLVLAVEGIEGTDALIARGGQLARSGARPVLVKVAKPQQDMRLDVPTFGPDTVAALQQAAFAGAFLQAGKTLLIDRARLSAMATAAGLFVAGIVP